MPISLAIWGQGVPISRESPYRSYTGSKLSYLTQCSVEYIAPELCLEESAVFGSAERS